MTTAHPLARPNRRHAPGRPSRPALTQRHSHTRAHRPTSSSKDKVEITTREHDQSVHDDSMADTFLQYCAVCDKQIIAPGSSVLYCSESCRNKDAHNSPSYTLFKCDSITPPLSKSTGATSSQSADIIPQLSPTITNRRPTYPNPTAPDGSDSVSTSPSSHTQGHGHSTGRHDSEAARYLGQFQASERPPSRHRYNRSSGSITPLLSTTPTSSASASIPYTPKSSLASSANAPLPPRNPRWSLASSSSRSVDLVIPVTQDHTAASSLTTVTDKMAATNIDDCVPTPTVTVRSPGGESLSYERKPLSGTPMSPGQSSLKQLLKVDEMRTRPGAEA